MSSIIWSVQVRDSEYKIFLPPKTVIHGERYAELLEPATTFNFGSNAKC